MDRECNLLYTTKSVFLTTEKPLIDSAQLIKEADEEMYQKKAQRKIRLQKT
ncbi:MAG: hypothetical protein IJX45_05415 [Spirochaetaceae bacterium]|nr:hypothetical protein [Spirochaetaceae bacterium]MBQ8561162.1 hypothetical protein [Spirochaetaceae bacterium]